MRFRDLAYFVAAAAYLLAPMPVLAAGRLSLSGWMLAGWVGGGIAIRCLVREIRVLRGCYEHGEYAGVYLLIASAVLPLYVLLVALVDPVSGVATLLAWPGLAWPYQWDRRGLA